MFSREGTSTIYTDLAEALAERGHEVTVLTKEERGNHMTTSMTREQGCKGLRVKIGNMYNVGLIEKAITITTIVWLMKRATRKYLRDLNADLILFEAPPVTVAFTQKNLVPSLF